MNTQCLAYPWPWLFKVFCRTFGNVVLLQAKDRAGESGEDLFQNRCQQSPSFMLRIIKDMPMPARAQAPGHRHHQLTSWGVLALQMTANSLDCGHLEKFTSHSSFGISNTQNSRYSTGVFLNWPYESQKTIQEYVAHSGCSEIALSTPLPSRVPSPSLVLTVQETHLLSLSWVSSHFSVNQSGSHPNMM